jgi:hypothetical protein
MPDGLKIYRTWQGGDATKGKIKSLDFTESRGVLAVLLCWMPLNQVSNIFLSLLLIFWVLNNGKKMMVVCQSITK